MIARHDGDRVQAVIDRAVDPRVGIVHDLQARAARPGAPRFFHYSAQLCNLAACGWQSNLTRMDGGAATPQDARTSALFEALRCYAAAFYAPHELELFSHAHAPHRSVPPARFALFSEEQYAQEGFPFEPFTDSTPVRWVPATSLGSGEQWYVPAAAALLPYVVRPGSEERSIQPSSPIGLACACSPDEAMEAAICDVIKHDALALCWNGRLSPPQVRIETLTDENYALVERFETIGRVTALNITLDIDVPAFLLCLQCPAEEAPAMVFAAGCDPDPVRAFRFALDDLALVLRMCEDLPTAGGRRRVETDGGVTDRADRLAYWCASAHRVHAGFLFGSSERTEFDEVRAIEADGARQRAHKLVARLRDAGLDVWFVDLTTSDLRDLGVSVVRAVVPGLQPLFGAPHAQALGGRRLEDVPARLGLHPARRTATTAPTAALPHPFLLKGIES